MNKTNLLLTLALISVLALSHAENVTQVGRYMTITNKPKLEQRNLLLQSVQVRFPSQVNTIEEAVNYLLRFSGYSLIAKQNRNEALNTILSKSLPAVDREIGSISLQSALMLLMGDSFILVHDPIERTLDFRLKPAFARVYAIKHQHLSRDKRVKA